MFQDSDYSILDHLKALCVVVDKDLRYLYVNQAVARHENLSREAMLGRTILEVHSSDATERLLPHLRECLHTGQPVEFEDQLSNWKIKIEPIAEGAFIHWIRPAVPKTKVKVKRLKQTVPLRMDHNSAPPSATSTVLEIDGWLEALDERTKESNHHILRVAEATVTLARMAGLPENELLSIRYGALLHDIGKIGIPARILLKPDSLTTEEWTMIRKHPLYAYDLLAPVEFLSGYLAIPYSHHEKWDGTGYPQGLKGEQIPLPARLFAVVDVWDSLSFDRVYRKAWSQEKIMNYIREQSGSQFDPNVVDLFFRAKEDLIGLGSP